MATKTSLLGLTKPAYTDAADIAVLNGNFDLIDKAVGNGARVVNLLDNSYFGNPINQRGLTSLTGKGFFIDRWENDADGITSTLNDLGLLASGANGIRQTLEHKHTGEELTLAYKNAAGTIICVNVNVPTATTTQWLATSYVGNMFGGLMQTSSGTLRVYLQSVSSPLVWVALYEGAYTADTLPAYQHKGYAAELAECMRYYQKGGQVVTVGTQYGTATKGIIRLRFCGMRSMPNITITGISSQGWGNIAPKHFSKEWTDQVGTDYFQNYMVEGDSSFVGQTIGVNYEASADL